MRQAASVERLKKPPSSGSCTAPLRSARSEANAASRSAEEPCRRKRSSSGSGDLGTVPNPPFAVSKEARHAAAACASFSLNAAGERVGSVSVSRTDMVVTASAACPRHARGSEVQASLAWRATMGNPVRPHSSDGGR